MRFEEYAVVSIGMTGGTFFPFLQTLPLPLCTDRTVRSFKPNGTLFTGLQQLDVQYWTRRVSLEERWRGMASWSRSAVQCIRVCSWHGVKWLATGFMRTTASWRPDRTRLSRALMPDVSGGERHGHLDHG